jgi:hypothetical protein
MRIITIDIYHIDGAVTVEPEGFNGKTAAVKAAFERALRGSRLPLSDTKPMPATRKSRASDLLKSGHKRELRQ